MFENPLTALKSADMQNGLSKRTVTPLPSGAVGSNPTLLTKRRSPSMVEELFGRLLVGDTGLRVRPPPVALYGDVC